MIGTPNRLNARRSASFVGPDGGIVSTTIIFRGHAAGPASGEGWTGHEAALLLEEVRRFPIPLDASRNGICWLLTAVAQAAEQPGRPRAALRLDAKLVASQGDQGGQDSRLEQHQPGRHHPGSHPGWGHPLLALGPRQKRPQPTQKTRNSALATPNRTA
jgi:hypothetical protein